MLTRSVVIVISGHLSELRISTITTLIITRRKGRWPHRYFAIASLWIEPSEIEPLCCRCTWAKHFTLRVPLSTYGV